jgi:hypothetical protein
MAALNRSFLCGVLLALSHLPALASCQVVIKHSWSIKRPEGFYGVFQYQTGPGPFDAHTAVLLGPRNFDIPVPLYALMVAGGIPVLALSAMLLRGISTRGSQPTNPAASGNGATAVLFHSERLGRAVPEQQRWA